MRRVMAVVLVAVVACGGCRLWTDEMLFVTRTNVAIDLDATPVTTDIGYKRDELVLAPIDAEGKVLPVLTSVGVRAGVSEFGANHSFATGEAALVMAKYLGSQTDLAGIDVPIPEGDVRRMEDNLIKDTSDGYLFGTNTTLGLGVRWDANYVPTAIALGFKRKELAIVPLRTRTVVTTDEAGNASVAKTGYALASLIATAHGGSRVRGRDDTGIVVGQTFATGHAATLLATHPAIRDVLAPAVMPDYDAEKIRAEDVRKGKEYDENYEQQDVLLGQIRDQFKAATADQKKQDIIDEAVRLGLVDAAKTSKDNFSRNLRKAQNGAKPEVTQALRQLLEFCKS